MPSVRDQQLAKIIGTNIARKLIEQDKTQMDIVNDLGFSKSTVSSWVNGSHPAHTGQGFIWVKMRQERRSIKA